MQKSTKQLKSGSDNIKNLSTSDHDCISYSYIHKPTRVADPKIKRKFAEQTLSPPLVVLVRVQPMER